MRLAELAADLAVPERNPDITGVTEDSRRVRPGMLFVAIPGTAMDGHAFVADAVGRGAAAVAAEREVPLPPGVPLVRVPSARRALATFAARFHGHPARRLHLIGFTGTFGKTSTSAILRDLLETRGLRPGVLGSLGARYGAFHHPGTGLTTPAPVELHHALGELAAAGADTVIMEVTSHALRTSRVSGLRLSGGLISAIQSGEHTDFHGTFEDYVAAKRLFLDYLSDDALLAYDWDNPASRQIAHDARVARRLGFSLEAGAADIVLRDIVLDGHGARFTADGPAFARPHPFVSSLLGRGHLRNVALALAYAAGAGVDPAAAAAVLRSLAPLRRRMERYTAGGRIVLDDTAAHPESFRATFEVAATIAAPRTVLVYAVRGNRGADINRRNAAALAALCAEFPVDRAIVTAAADVAGPQDRVTPEEADATRQALDAGGLAHTWHDSLETALRSALDATGAGDLIVLTGAQGMNEGKRLIKAG